MKNQKGITMVSLVVAIVVLFLISSVTINLSMDTYHIANIQSFISKMKVIQGKVDNIAQETDDVSSYGFQRLTDISDEETYQTFLDIISNPSKYNIDTSVSWNSESDSNPENYYYFKENDMEKMGLKNQDLTVIINFATRNIISKNGVLYKNKVYYRQYDVLDGYKLIN